MLVFMMTTHFSFFFPAEVQYLKHHYFGFVEDAQGFVFVSGNVVGLVYGKRLLRSGFKNMVQALLRRMKTIYLFQAFLILSIAVLAVLFWQGGTDSGMFSPFIQNPVEFTIAALLLVGGLRILIYCRCI